MEGRWHELTVVCLLKRGGPFDFGYVKALSQGVRRHLHRRHRFICLTDCDLLHRDWYRAHLIQCRPLRHDWPGNWAKLEIFRSGLFDGRLIYLDLDMMITGSLFDLGGYGGRLAMSTDDACRFDTSVMMWEGGDLSSLYSQLVADPVLASGLNHDSASWVRSTCQSRGIAIERIQDLVPDLMAEISSIPGGTPRHAAAPKMGLITFHNGPLPHLLADGSEFIRNNWV